MLLQAFLCSGAGGKYTLEKIDASADLSHSAVLSIYQDRQGTMWFGTYDGLNSYDGKNVKTFRSYYPESTGLTNNVIKTVCQADDNCIWCATDYVLNKFSLETYSTEVYDFSSLYTIHSNDSGNTFLIKNDSLYYYNTLTKEFIAIASGFTSDGGTAMYRKTYVSVGGNFWYFDEDSGNVRIFSVSSFSAPPEQVRTSEIIYRFHTRGIKDVFWQKGVIAFVDVNNDLFISDIENRSKVFVRNISSLVGRYGKIKGISPFYDDVFIGFAVNGLVRLSMQDDYLEQEIDRDMRIFGMYFDNVQGILWIATDGQGAICYKRENNIASSFLLDQLSAYLSRQVRSILTDEKGNLWFGTKGDGLVKIPYYTSNVSAESAEVILPEGRIKLCDYKRKPHEFQVFSLKESPRQNGFWVGTGSDGLFFYSQHRNRLLRIEGCNLPEIHSIVEIGDSMLYVATSKDGLHRFVLDGLSVKKSEKMELRNEGHAVELFYPMIAQGDSLLWLGSRTDGVIRFDCRTDEYEAFSPSSITGRSSDDVLSLCLSKSGVLHVGTTSGLVSLDVSGDRYSSVYIGRENGMLNDMIHGILEDENGVLWLSTNKGIAKYNPTSGMIHNYYYTSGVQIGEFSDDAYYKNGQGDMFFGGVDGLLMIKKNALSHFEIERELVLRDLIVNGREVKLGDYSDTDRNGEKIIRIKGPRASFSLFYSVPDFLSGRDIEYSYALEGFNDDWSVPSNSNEAFFSSVPSGKYRLKVRYKKDVFDADYRTYTAQVNVLAPWYLTTLAITIYVCIGLFLLVVLIRYLRRKNAKRKFASSKVGMIADTGQDIMDIISVIYHCCDCLCEVGLDETQIAAIADTIKDCLSGILNDGNAAPDLKGLLPSRYVVSSNERLADISDEVMQVIARQGGDASSIDVTVLPSMCYPIYRNAFRRILYMIYGKLASSDKEIKVVIEKDEKCWLRISVKAPWKILWVLYEDLNDSFARLIHQTGINMYCNDKGRGSVLTLAFPPAVIDDPADESKKNIVLLARPSDLSWLISDTLSSSYNVIVEESAVDAFERLHQPSTVLFMVDMRMFEGNERIVLDYLSQNQLVLSRVPILPMFTRDTDQSVCRELILYSDAYMMLPYDVPMLKNVVHKAIFGKTNLANVDIQHVLRKAGSLNEADAEFLKKVFKIIDDCLDREDLGSTLIAEKMAMSSSSFYRRFKKIAKVSLELVIKNYRLEKAAKLLKDTGASISDVIFDVGIASRSYFYKEFSKKFGMTPKEFKDKYCSDSA